MEKSQRQQTIVLIALLAIFAVMYGLLAFVNHINFRTYGLDLGLYNKALYDYAHLRCCDSSFFLWEPANLLHDHFDLYLMLLAPLSLILGQWTLLVVQIAAVLAGGLGVYKLIRLYTDNDTLPLLAIVCLMGFFGVWHALGFDYHSNVVAAMLLPWFLFFLKKRRFGWASFFLLLICIGKETLPIWMFFVCVALIWDYRKEGRSLCWIVGWMLFCVIYLLTVTLWLMPMMGEGSSRGFWRYDYMGANFAEMAGWIVSHPMEALQNLFVNFRGEAGDYGVKAEFYICLLASGLCIAIFKPNYLVMVIPILGQKMLAADTGFWGITNQYNVEFAPIVVIASFIVLSRLSKPHCKVALSTLMVAMTLTTTIYTTIHPRSAIRKENVRLFDVKHFHQPNFSKETAYRMLGEIPNDASVCATTFFTPHLAMRDSVYIFPMGLGYGAEYYMLKEHDWCYYEGEEEEIARLIADTAQYEILDTDGTLYLIHRKK